MRGRGFCLALLFFGCVSCAALPRDPSPAPSPEELIARVRARSQALQGLKGLAHLRVSAPGKNFTTQEVVFARRPGLLRLETLGPLGTPLFYFVTTGQDLSLYHPGENRFYQGPARARNFSLFCPRVWSRRKSSPFFWAGSLSFPMKIPPSVTTPERNCGSSTSQPLRAANARPSGSIRKAGGFFPRNIPFKASPAVFFFRNSRTLRIFLFRTKFISNRRPPALSSRSNIKRST